METAKIFWSGRSQAVRLPKAFRLEGNEVSIRRRGSAIILEPVVSGWAWLDELAKSLDEDAVAAIARQPSPQERPELDRVFEA